VEHGTFIVSSYCVAAFIIAALVAWIAFDYRALKRTLADYERRGLTRGSRRV
jgi:heme exporter protein CcmD